MKAKLQLFKFLLPFFFIFCIAPDCSHAFSNYVKKPLDDYVVFTNNDQQPPLEDKIELQLYTPLWLQDLQLIGSLEYLAGSGIGYRGGYATVGVMLFPQFLSTPDCCAFSGVQPFFDLRTHILNEGKAALNVGVGARFLCPDYNKIFGFNLYYDYRNTWKSYNQLGLGLEMLSICDDLFDMRLNFYLPVGGKTQSCSPHTFTYPGGFFAIATKKQRVLKGIDFEIDTQLSRFGLCCWPDFDLYMGAGWYYYRGKCNDNVLGARGRIGLEWLDCLYFEFRLSYDPLFKTTAQGLVSFVYYFGSNSKSCCNCCDTCSPCFLRQPVLRQDIIVQDKKRCFFKTNF